MLSIRMQRLGRKGHPTYRVVVQDARQTPTSGKFVAMLGSYDPHTKTSTLVKEKAEFYLSNGAQPSDRVVRLFMEEGVSLPEWVKTEKATKTRTIRNPEKLRKNRPAEEAPTEEVATPEAADVEASDTQENTTEATESDVETEVNDSAETPQASEEDK